MGSVNYTAKRNISSGHVIDTAYDLDFRGSATVSQLTPVRTQSVSLDGTTETVLDRLDDRWAVTATGITEAQLPLWREFSGSVAAGESFSFDAYGTAASPDNVQSVIIESGVTIARQAQFIEYFTASFTVRVL